MWSQKKFEIGKLQIELCNLEDRYTDCLQKTTQLKEGERESLLLTHDPVCSFLEKNGIDIRRGNH